MDLSDHFPQDYEPPSAVLAAYRRAIDAHSIVSITDRRGVITYVNAMFCKISGYTPDELIGSTHSLLNSGHHDKAFFVGMWQSLGQGNTWTGEICNRAKDGSTYWVDTVIVPLKGDLDNLEGYMSVRKLISVRKAVEQELQRSERFLANVAEVAKVGGWSLDLETQKLFWSDQTKLIHDLALDFQPRLDEAINYYAPEARSTITHAVEQAINTGQSWDLELPMITAKGRKIWVRAVGHLLKKEGASPLLVGTFQDITERRQVEDELREEIQQRHAAEQLLRDVLETIPDAVAAYDKDDRLLICNKGYLGTYAVSAEAIVPGASFEDIVRFGLKRGQYAEVGPTQEEQESWLAERLKAHREPPEQLNQKLRDGTWLQVREHRSDTGTTVGVRTDITALKRAEEKLRRFAEEDPLTGLFNRSRFYQALDEVLARPRRRTEKYGCVVLFDIDHFKPVNDAYGHDVGDEVLVEIATRMQSLLTPNDVAARLGGDEFVFILTDRKDKAACSSVLHQLQDFMEQPITTRGGPIKLSLSIGAASFRNGSINSRQLLKQADLAQYRAKEQGRAQWCWFSDDDRVNLDRDTQLGQALNIALDGNEGLDCRFTPVANAQTAASMGFCAELCWTRDGETIVTKTLQSLAQKTGQSARLSVHELRQTLKIIGEHEARGISFGEVWITVDAACLKIGHFADHLQEMCITFGVVPSQLTIAVHESALSDRSASAVEIALADIKAAGVRIAIDAFGSAASSLSTLKSLGIDKVRLSSDLTDELMDPKACDAVVGGLIGVAQTFNIQVYGANAQTTAHAVRLAHLGCNGLQGPVVGPSLPGDAVTSHIAAAALRTLEGLSDDMRSLEPSVQGMTHIPGAA